MLYPDVTIVIQGQLNELSLNSILDYQKYCPVILSYFDNSDLSLLDRHLGATRFVQNKFEPLKHPQTNNNSQNQYYQFQSTWSGAYMAATPFVLKVRSDWSIENIEPMLQALQQNPDKIISLDWIFRPYDRWFFHAADTVYAANTTTILNALEFCFQEIEEWGYVYPPEVNLTRGLLKAKGITPIEKYAREQIKENFIIVPYTQLGTIESAKFPGKNLPAPDFYVSDIRDY